MNRRKFVSNVSLISAGIGLGACENKPKSDGITNNFKFPLILSTWANTKANNAAFESINRNNHLLDSVVAGIKVPEADENDMSVGYGGRPDRAGRVTLDACIMDEKGNAGSVTYVQGYKHPIEIARAVMEKTPHVMLSGKGAEVFAASLGMKKENLLTDKAKIEYEAWKKEAKYEPVINIERHDTIGMLVIDKDGNLSGGCSTSGMAYKMEGRVGDSPIIGAGLFVDNEVGACTCTGHGEYVLRTLASFLVVELMRNGASPMEACQKAISRIINKHHSSKEEYQIGLIAVDKKGNIGYHAVRKGFQIAIKNIDNEIVINSEYNL